LYDGPFCVLSIVDNRTFRRLIYEVLDHDPDHTDIERFFRAFQAALQRRGLVLQGITTDGSNLNCGVAKMELCGARCGRVGPDD